MAERPSGPPVADNSIMNRPRPVVVIVVVTAAVALAIGLATFSSPAPAVDHSAYGYSVSVGTNATLTNVTLVVPLPAVEGRSPVADSVRAGNASVPDGWRYTVVEREDGHALRIEADEVVAERQPDGRLDGAYLVGTTVRTPAVIDTAEPFGSEPTVAPPDALRERPCPNQASSGPDSGRTCFAYDIGVYAAYDAPADALVDIRLIHNGVNVYEGGDHEMYYERVYTVFHGPQDGWTTVPGFASTEQSSR